VDDRFYGERATRVATEMTCPPRPPRRQLGLLIVAGLLAVPARADRIPADGRAIYADYCQQCHQATGLGVPGRFPPLVGSPWVAGSPRVLVRIVLDGIEGPIDVNGQRFDWVMPGARQQLSDEQVAALITYIRRSYSDTTDAIEPAMVSQVRATPHAGRWTVAELSGESGEFRWLVPAVLILIVTGILYRVLHRIVG
jgi:mono/diheme cytochrome c family protein